MHYIKAGGLKNSTSSVNLLRESLNIWINYLIYQLTLVWSNYSLPGPKGYWFNYKFLTFFKFKLQGMASSAGFKYGD